MLISPERLQLTFISAGRGETKNDGWVHHKTCPFFIVAQAVEGCYEISFSGNPAVCLQQGEAFLSPPGVPLAITHHCNRATGRFRMRWVHFNFRLHNVIELHTLYQLPPLVTQPWADRMGRIADRIAAVQKDQRQNVALALPEAVRIAELSFRVLGHLSDYLSHCGISPHFDPDMERLLPALEHAERYLNQPMQVAELAQTVNLSVPRFHAEFRRLFQASPMGYLRELRLRKAGDLLRNTDGSVKEIAAATGFCNQFHFSREFLRYYGESPSAYRKTPADRTPSY